MTLSTNRPQEGLVTFFPYGQEDQLTKMPKPYYRSVGAVVVDSLKSANPDVFLLHFPASMTENSWGENTQLMRETPEAFDGIPESVEETLSRGMREELGGIDPTIVRPIGTLASWLYNPIQSRWKRKDTLYHIVKCTVYDDTLRDVADVEGRAEIIREPLIAATARLRAQRNIMFDKSRGDLIEYPILEAAAVILDSQQSQRAA